MTTHIRQPHTEAVRRAKMRAADARHGAALLGGFRRTGKLVEVRLDDDQAADLIASLSGATGAERIDILSQLARAGIFESTPSDRCGVSRAPSSPATPSETAPFGADASPDVAPAGGTLPSDAPSLPQSPALAASPAPAEAALSVPAGAPALPSEPAAVPPAAAPVPVVAITGALAGADPSTPPLPAAAEGGAVPEHDGANADGTAPLRADELPPAVILALAEQQAQAMATGRCVGPLGSYARHRYEGGRECKRCRAADPRYGVIDRRAAKITGDAAESDRGRDEALPLAHPPTVPVAAATPTPAPDPEAGPDQDQRLATALETPGALAPEITASGSTTTGTSAANAPQATDDARIPFPQNFAVAAPPTTAIDRRSYIGSADAPAILGLSPHSTPWDVFARKTGAVEDKGGDWLEMGLDLEPVIAKWAARKLEATGLEKGVTILHPDETWAGATVDYFGDLPSKERAIIECKALGLFSPWRDDEVPVHTVGQLHWQCGIAKAAGERVGRLFVARMKGLAVDVFEVRYEPALFDAMLAKCKAFWAQVQARTPPPIDGSSSAKAWLESIYPSAKKALRPATEAEVFTITRYVVARDQAGAAKKRQDAAANEIRSLIGDAEGVIGGGVVAKWSGKEGAARRLDVRAVTGKGDE